MSEALRNVSLQQSPTVSENRGGKIVHLEHNQGGSKLTKEVDQVAIKVPRPSFKPEEPTKVGLH